MKCNKIVTVILKDWKTYDKLIHFLLTRDIGFKVSYPDKEERARD